MNTYKSITSGLFTAAVLGLVLLQLAGKLKADCGQILNTTGCYLIYWK